VKTKYPEEKGKLQINGHQMEWILRRSKGESAFGIRASRIFELQIKRDGKVTLEYGRGLGIRPDKDDEETPLCLNHVINTYGRNKKKEKD
jgi:hypothetical protein